VLQRVRELRPGYIRDQTANVSVETAPVHSPKVRSIMSAAADGSSRFARSLSGRRDFRLQQREPAPTRPRKTSPGFGDHRAHSEMLEVYKAIGARRRQHVSVLITGRQRDREGAGSRGRFITLQTQGPPFTP